MSLGQEPILYPLLASGFAGLGLILRGSSAQREVLLHISPRSGPAEHPSWAASLLERNGTNEVKLLGDTPLAAPVIVNGRLTAPLWLRLRTAPDATRAAISTNGTDWTVIAAGATPAGPMTLGLFAQSGIDTITTDVLFDHVTLGT